MYSKEQLHHLDLPEEFRQDAMVTPEPQNSFDLSWDLILLGITLFLVLENNNS